MEMEIGGFEKLGEWIAPREACRFPGRQWPLGTTQWGIPFCVGTVDQCDDSYREGPPVKRHRCNAYTLLEVILAITISLVFLGALYRTLKLHLNTSQWGKNAVEQEQLYRAVGEQLRHDLAQLVSTDYEEAVESTFSEIPGRIQSTSRYTGLTGQSRWLEFYSDRMIVDTDRRTHTPVGLTRIRYELTPNARSSAGSDETTWTLTRLQIPAEFADAQDEGYREAEEWSRIDVLSNQVRWSHFEFWDTDKNNWVDSWQDSLLASPPAAVCLSLQLIDSGGSSGVGSRGESPVHRVVVDLTRGRNNSHPSSSPNNPYNRRIDR